MSPSFPPPTTVHRVDVDQGVLSSYKDTDIAEMPASLPTMSSPSMVKVPCPKVLPEEQFADNDFDEDEGEGHTADRDRIGKDTSGDGLGDDGGSGGAASWDKVVNTSWSRQMEVVDNLTRFVRQKAGGTFQPQFKSAPYCLFCSQGSTCLGSFCLGPKTTKPKHCKMVAPPTPPTYFCPGLTGETKLPSLIELKFEDTSKKIQSCSVLPYGTLFGWGRIQSRSYLLHIWLYL